MKRRKFSSVLSTALAASLAVGSAISASAAVTVDSTSIIPDYSSYEETLRAGEELNEELMGEGAVLLKNQNNALPLTESEKKVTMFGACSVNLILGGSGSGGGTVTDAMTSYDLADGLELAGFQVNQVVRQWYENQEYSSEPTTVDGVTYGSEVDPSGLEDFMDSYQVYGDAAIVVLGRTGGEMADRLREGIDGDKDKHYLELTDNERKLLEHVEANFDKVIVLINSSNVMELGDLEDDENVDAILWVGGTGTTGTAAIGKILNGEINPSGRTVDVWMADMKQDPTWFNSGDLSQFYEGEDTYANQLAAMYEEGSDTAYDPDESAGSYNLYSVLEYKEGIYMGYRWYETAAAEGFFDSETQASAPGNTGVTDTYYNRNTGVVYPFGYGMSYTTFAYSNYSVTIPEDQNGNVVVEVDVTNTGNYAGKEVVEVYAHSPYINGQIEKADVDLVDYAKTETLQPGETQHVTIEFPLSDLAQFDYNDANGNGKTTYEIDAATEYSISLRSDSHTVKDDCTYSFDINETLCFDTDSNSGNEISNMFSQGDLYDSMIGKTTEELGFVTRADGKFALPQTASVADRTFNEKYLKEMDENIYYEPYEDEESDAYYRASVPSSWTQTADRTATLDVTSLIGKSYTAPAYDSETGTWTESDDEDTLAWEAFLNQMSYDELVTLVSSGSAGATALDSIGLVKSDYNDGPGQLKGGANGNQTGEYGTYWVSAVVIASTWNVDLAEKEGQIIGNESLYLGTTGWWGPGANIHRTPFGGRNFEYYSQDGVQGGKIAAAVITGVQKKGVTVFLKHVGANEQEYLRAEPNNATVITEQALRQIYLKCFEYAYKAGCNGGMMCTTRIGISPAANNYTFIQSLMREEWGATDAIFMEDVEGETWHEMNLNLRAGNSLPLTDRTGQISGTWDDSLKTVTVDAADDDTTQIASTTQWYWVRANAQHVIYSTINSNAVKNNYDLSAFDASALENANSCMEYSASIAADVSAARMVSYEIVDGALPEGMTLSNKGVISGTANEAGTYNFTVQLSCDDWITKKVDFTLNVEESVVLEGSTEFVVNEDSEIEVQTPLNPEEYDAIVYSVSDGQLPDGVQMNENGLIYGTPTEEGEYTFTIKVTATKTEDSGSSATVSENVLTRTVTISVVSAAQ